MKKIKIIKEAMIEEDFFSCPFEDLKGIKLTEEQAMHYSFFEEDASFDELVAKYGQENVLTIGEFYDGYCILYDTDCNNLVRMQGSIEQLSNSDELPNLALNNSKLYKICYENNTKQLQNGYAKFVHSFGNEHFELVVKCSDTVGNTLRQKLVEGAISGNLIELSDEEHTVIVKYFNQSTFARLFKLLE